MAPLPVPPDPRPPLEVLEGEFTVIEDGEACPHCGPEHIHCEHEEDR
jgi:hypothetical protein